MHARQAIREAVVAALVDKTAALDRVFKTREVPWRKIELPGISVYALEEEKPDAKRMVKLGVVAVVSLSEKVDDALDDLALEIETAMATDITFGGKALASKYTGMAVEITEDQGLPVGAMRLTYEAWYL
jgi:hypothetical protein